MFIYGIQNKINKKWYIGLTTRNNVFLRWEEHVNALKANRHVNNHLQNAWNKYGHLNFDFTIISEFPEDFDIKELSNIEIRTIALYDSFKNGYNQTIGGDGVNTSLYFEYSVAKNGFNRKGKQKYVIYDRNISPLIISIDKDYLEGFLSLLNSDEEAGLKAIEEAREFKYSVAKNGFTHKGKQKYVIMDRNHSPLIYSINKTYLEFVVDLLNENEEDLIIEENNKFKLKNKKELKDLYKNKKLI